jgi:hypothetical protein
MTKMKETWLRDSFFIPHLAFDILSSFGIRHFEPGFNRIDATYTQRPIVDLTQSTWLAWLLGVDLSSLPPDARNVSLTWTNMPQSWGVFVLLGVVALMEYAVFALYRRELDTCPRRVKMLLAAVRVAVLLLLLVVYLGPAVTYFQISTREPFVAVLRDASQSMNTADRYHDDDSAKLVAAATGRSADVIRSEQPSRVTLLNELLARDNNRFVRQLQARGKVRVMDFSDRVEKQETRAAMMSDESTVGTDLQARTSAPLPPLVATGRGTDIHAAIKEALSLNPLAAIVLLTDGQHTGNDDPRLAAQEAKQKGVPLLIVGVGDPSRPRNLRLANIYVRPHAWQNDPFEIEAVLLTQGIPQQDVTLELLEHKVSDADDQPAPGTVVQRSQVTLPQAGGQLRHSFSHTATEPGRFVYSVRVEPVADERTEEDNQLASQVVKVLSRDAIRVLAIAGAPTWDYQMVQRLLSRDPTMTISCWLQTLDIERPQEGDRPITKLPTTQQELNWYDVVMLFDPNPDEFDEAWVGLLKKFAGDHAGGVLYMAGPKYSGQFLTNPRTAALKDILPVRFGDVGATEVASLLSTNQQAWPLRIVSANVDHPVMSFYQDRQASMARWENLPGIFWSFPALEPKPTSQVLVEHSDPTLRRVEGSRPLIVSGRYGSGHSLYLGFNGTWRWRRAGRQAEFFDRFWIQTTRYLVESRSLEGRRRGFVQTDRDRYEIGDKITVTARLQDAAYEPLAVPQVEATLQSGDGAPLSVTLKQVMNQPGQYEATLTAQRTGVHTLHIALPESAGSDDSRIDTSFTVELPSVETNQVWLDKPLLTDLARISGGRYFDIHQLDALPAAVPDATETSEIRGRPDPLWDMQRMLFLLVGLLSFEWAVRKGFKLL